jgi:hypothetical protein
MLEEEEREKETLKRKIDSYVNKEKADKIIPEKLMKEHQSSEFFSKKTNTN